MNRFLSTSHKLHHHHPTTKSGTEIGTKKHDFHAYLCRLINNRFIYLKNYFYLK